MVHLPLHSSKNGRVKVRFYPAGHRKTSQQQKHWKLRAITLRGKIKGLKKSKDSRWTIWQNCSWAESITTTIIIIKIIIYSTTTTTTTTMNNIFKKMFHNHLNLIKKIANLSKIKILKIIRTQKHEEESFFSVPLD